MGQHVETAGQRKHGTIHGSPRRGSLVVAPEALRHFPLDLRAGKFSTRYMERESSAVHLLQPQLENDARRKLRRLTQRLINIDHELDQVGYGLSLEGASAADLVKSMRAKSEAPAQKQSA